MGKDLVGLFSQPDYFMQAHSHISGQFRLRCLMVKSHCPAQSIHYHPAVVTMFEVALNLGMSCRRALHRCIQKGLQYLPGSP